jgi:FdhD protein
MSSDAFLLKQVQRISSGSSTREEANLIVEEPLVIRVDGISMAMVMRSPGHDAELVMGLCLTEGLVTRASEITGIEFSTDTASGTRSVADVTLCLRVLDSAGKRFAPLGDGQLVSTCAIVNAQYKMSDLQALSRLTTAAHAVGLFSMDGELIVVREDVGRHNAIDKVIGFAMREGIERSQCFLLLSGRVSLEMIQKAICARVPIVAAVSAATAVAVDMADRLGCTLIGRLRDADMIVYTHPERLAGLRVSGCWRTPGSV